MSKIFSGLLIFSFIGLVGILLFAWYRFHTPLAQHINLADTIKVEEFDLPLEKHRFVTNDHVKLVGYSAQQENAKGWIILIHGYTPNGWKSMLDEGSFLYKEGYNIFLPSLRSFGESEGEFIYLGTREWMDVWAANRLVKEQLNSQNLQVGWYGISMGAAAALSAAGKANGTVDFLIIQVPYASVQHLLVKQIEEEKLPRWLFEPLSHLVPQLTFGLDYRENEPLFSAQLITVPTLVIGAERDNQVLFEDSQLIFDSISTSPDQKVYASLNTGHDMYAEQPTAIQNILSEFLSKVSDF